MQSRQSRNFQRPSKKLQVANEALQSQVEELTVATTPIENHRDALDDFAQAIPIAAVWTDPTGTIEKGNEAASQLLNMGKHHLQGKPLMLFITDRSALFAALRALSEADGVPGVDVDVTVRPGERRPPRMKLWGRRLQHASRCVWFLQEDGAATSRTRHCRSTTARSSAQTAVSAPRGRQPRSNNSRLISSPPRQIIDALTPAEPFISTGIEGQ